MVVVGHQEASTCSRHCWQVLASIVELKDGIGKSLSDIILVAGAAVGETVHGHNADTQSLHILHSSFVSSMTSKVRSYGRPILLPSVCSNFHTLIVVELLNCCGMKFWFNYFCFVLELLYVDRT